MKVLNSQELRSIEQFFQLRQEPLRRAMKQYLSSKYEKVIATKDYVMAIGNIPVGITAHMDTVFKRPPKNIFYDRVKNVMWSPNGLGADDRAGVYSIVQLIKMGYRPTVIFTTDEEVGGLGADALTEDYPEPPTDLKYIIEMDRQGSNDCVFYDCDNPVFNNYIESFGFTTNFGSFSDISTICPIWGVAGVNLSVGYYDEHSFSETLYIGQMYNTINRVKKMFDNINNADFFKFILSEYAYKWWNTNPTPEDYDGWDPSFGVSKEQWREWLRPPVECHHCKHKDYTYNMAPVRIKKDQWDYFCLDCVANLDLPICEQCGEIFIPEGKEDKICPKCKEILKND